ncbi:MAG: hypothetical protein C4534_02100 [Gaiellales bacterium]|nr:MAG: hypothetical protein C4534_02100 [Gaiellales bacterium]
MGREIKRVPLDFCWPLNRVWPGYLNPWHRYSTKCPACDGSGHNPATKQIEDDWYDFAGTGRRWSDNLTQDEVDALIEEGRLHDLTSRFVRGEGWLPTGHHPTAEEVNLWSRQGLGHDAINRWICVETRAKRLGTWGSCERCQGEGEVWTSPEMKQKSESWEREEPPTGEGWQTWETVSEGSPVSPVFATSDELAAWLVGQGYSEAGAAAFIKAAWVPSMVSVEGQLYRDIESATVLNQKEDGS